MIYKPSKLIYSSVHIDRVYHIIRKFFIPLYTQVIFDGPAMTHYHTLRHTLNCSDGSMRCNFPRPFQELMTDKQTNRQAMDQRTDPPTDQPTDQQTDIGKLSIPRQVCALIKLFGPFHLQHGLNLRVFLTLFPQFPPQIGLSCQQRKTKSRQNIVFDVNLRLLWSCLVHCNAVLKCFV